MLTLRGIYKDGTITFLDNPPDEFECEVQVTFVNTIDPYLRFPGKGEVPTLFVSVRDPEMRLTENELDVLRLASTGLKVREIAEQLDCNYSRVTLAFFNLFHKFQVHCRAGALFKAEKLGFLPSVQEKESFTGETCVFGIDPDLNQRERDVLQLAYEGLKRGEIAAKLGITPTLVENSYRVLLRRLKAQNKIEAIIKGRKLGLISLDGPE